MITPEIVAYVVAQLKAGTTPERLRVVLAGAKWKPEAIEEALAAAQKAAPIAPTPAPAPAPASRPAPASTPAQQVAPVSPAPSMGAGSAQVAPPQTPATPPASAVSAFTISAKPDAPKEPSLPKVPVTPTLRALTAIDSQFRAGIEKESIRSLLQGVGWEPHAIDEAFLAVAWGESLLSPKSQGVLGPSPDARAPRLGVIDEAIAQTPILPSRRSLTAINALLKDGVTKGNIRTLLLGVGWDARAIDEAFLAVEWRDAAPGEQPRFAATEEKKDEKSDKGSEPELAPEAQGHTL